MSRETLDGLWADADKYYHCEDRPLEHKIRLLTYQEGVFFGYALATPNPALMQRAFRLREQVAEMLEELRACDSAKD